MNDDAVPANWWAAPMSPDEEFLEEVFAEDGTPILDWWAARSLTAYPRAWIERAVEQRLDVGDVATPWPTEEVFVAQTVEQRAVMREKAAADLFVPGFSIPAVERRADAAVVLSRLRRAEKEAWS